ncbi:1350_t:CDS:2, partial [Acaulospora colombiana]
MASTNLRERSKPQKPLQQPRSSAYEPTGTPSNQTETESAATSTRPTPQSMYASRSTGSIFDQRDILFQFQTRQPSTPGIPSPFGDINVHKLDFSADPAKQAAVVSAFRINSIRILISAAGRDAWGFDEYHPVKRKGTNLSSDGGIGYTIVDTLDTMHIMGLEQEFAEAREWVARELTFDREGKFNTFEITIRVLGG